MAAFDYTALDNQGRTKKGTLQADTPRQVRQQLREQGLIPLTVNEVSETSKSGLANSLGGRFGKNSGSISLSDLALLTRQLATLLNAGLPVEEALRGVVEQSEKPRVKSILLAVRAKVMEGHTLASGLADFPKVFPELYRATVGAGEEAGHLGEVLLRVADYTENQQWMRQKVKQAAIYPLLMTMVSIAIVIFLMVYVVPQIVSVFEDSGQSLPALTKVLISISDFLAAYGIYMLAGLILLGFGWRRLLQNPQWQMRVHQYILKLPVIGRAVKIINTARFARTFGILSSSGVSVLDAMNASSQVIANLPMREAVQNASERVREGQSIAKALGDTKYFPAMMIHLIASGEASGQLEPMLAKAAESQEREVDALIGGALSLFEPIMILFMGTVVLIIVLAVLLPIFEVTQMVGV
jgi:general secretion pathway protein F